MDVGCFSSYFPGKEEGYDFESGVMDEEPEWDFWIVGIARVPCRLLRRLAAVLDGHHNQSKMFNSSLPLVWMTALGLEFPDTPLAVVRSGDPSLLP
jgi:hypothetical protein